jgi:HJR/Mrr/RecB family endonuclease
MSAAIDQNLEKICAEERSLRATLGEVESQLSQCLVKRREVREEKAKYERALWIGPVITTVDVWPLYALFVLAVVGPSALLVFGVLRAIWLPTWLAGSGAALAAAGVGYCGWRLRDVETDIRRRYQDNPASHIQQLQPEIHEWDNRLKSRTHQRDTLQRQLSEMLAQKQAIEAEIVLTKEKHRAEEELQREKEERDKKQAILQLLNGRWETLRGIPFEEFLAKVLRLHGYQVELTPASNDQGVDLVAVINGQRVAIQAKGYANMVGNESVQQVIAGKRFYQCNCAAVITNSSFTKSALVLAESNECLMIDYTVIPMMIFNGWPEKGVRR